MRCGRMKSPPKNERNAAIVAAYLAGAPQVALAARYGISCTRIGEIVHGGKNYGVGSLGGAIGRPAVWADCPEHLRTRYTRLRRAFGAQEARRRVEAAEALKAEVALVSA